MSVHTSETSPFWHLQAEVEDEACVGVAKVRLQTRARGKAQDRDFAIRNTATIETHDVLGQPDLSLWCYFWC